jgi:protein unc-79
MLTLVITLSLFSEPSLTPACTPNSQTGLNCATNSSTCEENNHYKDNGSSKPNHKKSFKNIEKTCSYASPESPLSKMDLMSPPPSADSLDGLTAPKNLGNLEIPTPERLLPIGSHGKEGMTALVDKVREVLDIPDISHLKHSANHDRSDHSNGDVTPTTRANSPRKLIKQVALESPPNNANQNDDPHNTILKSISSSAVKNDKGGNLKNDSFKTQRQRLRKVGPFAIGSQSIPDDSKMKYAGCWPPHDPDDSDGDNEDTQPQNNPGNDGRPGGRNDDEYIVERCSDCGTMKEEYTDEEIGLLLVNLGTFIHREPALAAQFLPEILGTVSK